ncbi:MAG: hypothetical protein WDN04_26780 [Rhodospirillales bacterium]
MTPGYWRRPDLTRAAFDDEGFYLIGDAGRLVDPGDPARGIEFDGRLAEDFKLMSGTWVHVGALRVKAIGACTPVVQDAVITGHDREQAGMLVFSKCCRLPRPVPRSRRRRSGGGGSLPHCGQDETCRGHARNGG